MDVTPSNFDEAYYLRSWLDVERAVQSGAIRSGYDHWKSHGLPEGRAYRLRHEAKTFGRIVPDSERLAANPADWMDREHAEYRHRGFVVRCCLQPQTREKIAEIVGRLKGGLVVEVGTFGGATLLHLAQMAQKNNTRLVGIDPWEKTSLINGRPIGPRQMDLYHWSCQNRWTLENIVGQLEYQHVQLIHDTSLGAVDAFADESIDLAIIDGDHSEEAAAADLAAYWPKVRPGGWIWGDDYDWPEVRRAADRFSAEIGEPLELWHTQFFVRKSGGETH